MNKSPDLHRNLSDLMGQLWIGRHEIIKGPPYKKSSCMFTVHLIHYMYYNLLKECKAEVAYDKVLNYNGKSNTVHYSILFLYYV